MSEQLRLIRDNHASAHDNDILQARASHTVAVSRWEPIAPKPGIYAEADCRAAIVKRDAAGSILYTLPYNDRMLIARAARMRAGSGESFPEWEKDKYNAYPDA